MTQDQARQTYLAVLEAVLLMDGVSYPAVKKHLGTARNAFNAGWEACAKKPKKRGKT